MSVGKTAASLVVALLAEQGKIDATKPIEAYLPDFADTAWAGTSVQDVLDMATGMDIVETADNRANPRSVIARFNLAVNAEPNADGKVETQVDVIKSAPRSGPPGQAFEYSSVNTVVLALLAEAVTEKRFTDIFQELVWSKMTVEGDMQIGMSPDGVAQAEGLYMTRLRDLARYGMLYTPSWGRAAREQIVSDGYLRKIQTGGRKDLFLKGELGNRLVNKYFTESPPEANSWQWDGVFADGDFFKSGSYSQGIYVSPAKDVVVVWFGTNLYNDMTHYARAIANAFEAN
jgi:CubicO group peptidase (beta-lactamase class C family)